MRFTRVLLSGSLVIAVTIGPLSAAEATKAAEAVQVAKLEISTVGEIHVAGEPLTLQITYVNPTAQPLSLGWVRSWYFPDNLLVEMTGPGDKTPGHTSFFQSLIDSKKAQLMSATSIVFMTVEPNQPIKRELRLSLYFDCSAVGEYSGRVTTTTVKDAEGKPVTLTGSLKFTVGWPK